MLCYSRLKSQNYMSLDTVIVTKLAMADLQIKVTRKLTKYERFNKRVKTMVSEVLAKYQEDTPVVDDALKIYIFSVVGSKVKDTSTTASSTSDSTPSITYILKSKLA